ncbi:MAG: M20 family metallopeptidase [Desulfurococcales archaeon]|nr:M20 family metallopeptidase [Desulfurococcales archaeon]
MSRPAHIREGYEYAVDILKRLISIPSVSPRGEHYGEIASLLEEELSRIADHVTTIKVPGEYQERHCTGAGKNPRYIVLARINGSSNKTLHFNGHYDVVPGGQGWRVTSPFNPVIVNGKLYGRGAIDMKGGIAAVLGAVKALQASNGKAFHNVEIALVPDEEIGGDCGTKYLVDEVLKEKLPDYVIIPEPSGLQHPWNGHKGLLWTRLTVIGKNAHGSTPWRGKNAFLLASQLAIDLQKTYTPILSTRKSRYKTIPEESMYPTVMIGGEAGVKGGGKTNQVPGEFYFTLDRRLIPEEKVSDVKAEIEAITRWLSTLHGLEYRIEYISEMEPAINEPKELYNALKTAAQRVGVSLGEPVVCPGGLDLRYYTMKGIETLAYGPSGETAHAPDEFIDLRELEKLVGIYYYLIVDGSLWS